jgi:hypothetical protein
MEQATTIGLDIAKHVFQLHGADAAGHVLFRKRITRVKLLGFLAAQTRCVVAMEACAGAHYWAREIAKLGHHVRLIGQRKGHLWHWRAAAGRKDRDTGTVAGVRRPCEERRRQLDIRELRQLWCRLYKTEASPHLSRELLLQAIRLPKITRVLGRAVPCSAVARQRRKIIANRLALLGEESVSVGHRRHRPG